MILLINALIQSQGRSSPRLGPFGISIDLLLRGLNVIVVAALGPHAQFLEVPPQIRLRDW